jgi:2',3'-cyclic-nucleotide 2'-phosphodiesterase (5'-nucleotidase family)
MQMLMAALTAPKICANMYHDLGNGTRGELIFKPYQIWNIKGIKIGFLGYTDPLVPLRQSPAYSKGIMYTRPDENLQYYVEVLRNKENCGFVIIIAHLGLSQQIALANMPACEGVNYILGGDTHERVRKPILCKYAKVVEPGAFGSFIGKLDLTIENGKVIAEDYELLEVSISKINTHEKVNNILIQNEAAFKKHIETIVGYSTVPLYRYFVVENTIDTLILDALNWKFPTIDIVLSNGFRFCPPSVTRDKTGNIPITNGFIFDMFPVDSWVRTAKATGKQIYDWMEKELNSVFSKDASQRVGGWVVKFKGLEVHFNAFDNMNNRIKAIKVKGEYLIESKVYTILACEREGDPENVLCRMDNVWDAKNTKITLHATMIEYLTANSPVTPLPKKNAVIMDAPATLLSQVWGVDYEFR